MSEESRRRDPLGKRALFWVPEPGGAEAAAWDPLLDEGPVRVKCPSCRAASRIGYLDLVVYQLPGPVWWPLRRYGHRMRCPACRRRVWASVSLRAPGEDGRRDGRPVTG
jgi:hypothetical protein